LFEGKVQNPKVGCFYLGGIGGLGGEGNCISTVGGLGVDG